jgi:hypothetical protein
MADNTVSDRQYGSRYDDTKHITDLRTLAERMLSDWALLDGRDCDAAGVPIELQVRLYGPRFMEVIAWGLKDTAIYLRSAPGPLNQTGEQYRREIDQFIQSYGWLSRAPQSDRRFFFRVVFVGEREWRSPEFYEPIVTIL